MLRVAAALLAWSFLWAPVAAQTSGFPPGAFQNRAALDASGGGGACAEYTTWLAATSGTSGTQQSAMQAMICGGVTDGWWAKLDYFYWFRINTTATAAINVVTPGTFNLSISGSCTFTANSGWAGDGLTCVGDTGYTPSTSGRITQNTASAGVYTVASSGTGGFVFGVVNNAGTSSIAMQPGTSGVGFTSVNSAGVAIGSGAVNGNWAASRNGAGTPSATFIETLNGSALAGSPFSDATIAAPDQHMVVFALKVAGGANVVFTDETLISQWIGINMTLADLSAMHTRMNTACLAISGSGC